MHQKVLTNIALILAHIKYFPLWKFLRYLT